MDERDDKKVGTGYTNLQQILAANNANRLGSTLLSGVQGVANNASSTLDAAKNKFQDSLGTTNSTIQNNKEMGQSIVEQAGSLKAGPGTSKPEQSIQSFKLRPVGLGSLSDEDIGKYKNYQNSQYEGPQGLDNEDQLKNMGKDAQNLGNEAGSRGGRLDLLKRFATQGAQGSYTARKQALDELYLGGSEDKLRQIKQTTAGLGDSASRSAELAKADAQRSQKELTEGKAGVAKSLQDKTDVLLNGPTGLNTRLSNALSTKAAQYGMVADKDINDPAYRDNLKKYMPSYNPDSLYGADPFSSNYFHASADPTLSNIASPDERARVIALQKLAGADPTVTQDAKAYNPNEFYSFDKAAFDQTIPTSQKSYSDRAGVINNELSDILKHDQESLNGGVDSNGYAVFKPTNAQQADGIYAHDMQVFQKRDQLNQLRHSLGMSPVPNPPPTRRGF